jgi:hypothetical protein
MILTHIVYDIAWDIIPTMSYTILLLLLESWNFQYIQNDIVYEIAYDIDLIQYPAARSWWSACTLSVWRAWLECLGRGCSGQCTHRDRVACSLGWPCSMWNINSRRNTCEHRPHPPTHQRIASSYPLWLIGKRQYPGPRSRALPHRHLQKGGSLHPSSFSRQESTGIIYT